MEGKEGVRIEGKGGGGGGGGVEGEREGEVMEWGEMDF